jgi:hypothetical protein
MRPARAETDDQLNPIELHDTPYCFFAQRR